MIRPPHPAISDDELHLPMLFVPHGEAPPADWLARHPDWVRIPATMVPRDEAAAEAEPHPPIVPVAALAVPLAIPAAEAMVAAGTMLAAMAAAAAAWRAREQGGGNYMTSGGDPGLADPWSVVPSVSRPEREGFSHLPPLPSSESLVPPVLDPEQEGFSHLPPLPSSETLVPPGAAFPHILSTPADDPNTPDQLIVESRNHGLPPGTATNSTRARKNAALEDSDIVEILENGGGRWEAHHLITVGAIRGAYELFAAAASAGWKTDDRKNVAALPDSSESQKLLRQAGKNRPYHDNAHQSGWTEMVKGQLKLVEEKLSREKLVRGTPEYNARAKMLIEQLQDELRQRLPRMDRVTQLAPRTGGVPA